MCWNAPVSFITFGVGTFLNIVSYFILKRRDASMVITFLFFWQYGLLMQIPEGIAWVRIDESIEVESRVALFLNITQPLALFLIMVYLKTPFRYGHVTIFLYFLVLGTQFDQLWEQSQSIAPVDDCSHLNLGYWNTSRGTLYVVTTLLILSELTSVYWIIVNGSIFMTSLILALALYSCGSGSMWCWMIFVAGPILVIMERIQTPIIARFKPPPLKPTRHSGGGLKGIVVQLEKSCANHANKR
jgi:hypothetical protein